MKLLFCIFTMLLTGMMAKAQITIVNDSLPLKIKNFSPNYNIHIDSNFRYEYIINKDKKNYFWFLRKAPAGLKIDKDSGTLILNINKSYFLSGKLKYDVDYKVGVTVQNLNDEKDRIDTTFTISFYNTEIIKSSVKLSVADIFYAEEGDSVRFKIQCETGSFPIENISFISNYPIESSTKISKCGDVFTWYIPFDFIKDTDKEKTKTLKLMFVGRTSFNDSDTGRVTIIVKENINYPMMVKEFEMTQEDIRNYILQLKGAFMSLDKKVKRTKGTRTSFDLASASTALGGTVFSSLPSDNQKRVGKILPSVGVTLIPVKEATAPNNSTEQNMASLIRSSIKRLEFLLSDTKLLSERDPEIISKTRKLRTELSQMQVQLIDIPMPVVPIDQAVLDAYFNNPKVMKKYKLKKK